MYNTILWLREKKVDVVHMLTHVKNVKIFQQGLRTGLGYAHTAYSTNIVVVRNGKFVTEALPELVS